MKKILIAALVSGLAFSGVSAGSASAASGNTIQNVKTITTRRYNFRRC
ncbi:Uncharacterised protein [Staphylococcus gallinarum]|uniref:Uncharacterized protein n=1 Tax=Staphylococcus gallinarum TaxID=1293 RepID=A0A380FEL8_STAGA|nr:Uncharacterised protein [Staphylococcus gallinarum]